MLLKKKISKKYFRQLYRGCKIAKKKFRIKKSARADLGATILLRFYFFIFYYKRTAIARGDHFREISKFYTFWIIPMRTRATFRQPVTDEHILMFCSNTIKVKIFSKVIASCYRRRLQNKKNSEHVKKKLWPWGPRTRARARPRTRYGRSTFL